MEYVLISVTLVISLISMIVSLRLVKRFEKIETAKKSFDEEIQDAQINTKAFYNAMNDLETNIMSKINRHTADLDSKCQTASNLCEIIKSNSDRLYLVDKDAVRVFSYDAYMQKESEEQQAADDMLKYQTEVLLRQGATILDSGISIADIPRGTVHRVIIKYIMEQPPAKS